MMIYKIFWHVLLIFFLFSCEDSAKKYTPYDFTELAMQPGMTIVATNKNGKVTIEYISSLKRRYRWGEFDETRFLIPRKERWLGRLGAYEPAEAHLWEIFSPRIVAEDSQLHFENLNDLELWLNQGSAVLDWVYTDNGLVVGFAESPERNQVNIEIYQLYINGKKPSQLDGSQPEKLEINWK